MTMKNTVNETRDLLNKTKRILEVNSSSINVVFSFIGHFSNKFDKYYEEFHAETFNDIISNLKTHKITGVSSNSNMNKSAIENALRSGKKVYLAVDSYLDQIAHKTHLIAGLDSDNLTDDWNELNNQV